MEQRLRKAWEKISVSNAIEDITLHYLSGKVHVEAGLPISAVSSVEEAQRLAQELRSSGMQIPEIGEIKINLLLH